MSLASWLGNDRGNVHGYLLFGEAYHNFALDLSAIGVRKFGTELCRCR
jgi:hypothetical protein